MKEKGQKEFLKIFRSPDENERLSDEMVCLGNYDRRIVLILSCLLCFECCMRTRCRVKPGMTGERMIDRRHTESIEFIIKEKSKPKEKFDRWMLRQVVPMLLHEMPCQARHDRREDFPLRLRFAMTWDSRKAKEKTKNGWRVRQGFDRASTGLRQAQP